MNNERQERILDLLNDRGEIHLSDLKNIFPQVSLMTLRRDLSTLENRGFLIRTHGGAVSLKKLSTIHGEEDAYSLRAAENTEAKMNIAEKAMKYLDSGRSLYLDAGSTIMCLARNIPDKPLSILTSGINIATELTKRPKVTIYLTGGQLNHNSLSVSGPTSMSMLDFINIDIAFMAASGYTPENGFTVSNYFECELKKAVIKKAKKVIMMADSSKFNKVLAFTFADIPDLDVLICEKKLPDPILKKAVEAGVEIA
ncbi:MAG TPA: DeoR/GlpR transcriptional regulator [Ruminiclostridium sp.]|nr:DeoR/GlpR transcriptional regulator [Clostridiaceae bacterium]HAA25326.1 DeoR/GlpR transcriptional regulator [Ruminiclostridium sp.]